VDEVLRHVFATLTYTREKSLERRWSTCSRDFNRYLQELRRLHDRKVQYLRVVEKHKDNYPHIHIIIQFPNAIIRVTNSKYFDRTLYKKWKALWQHGHSDYQKPYRSGQGTLSYIIKYLLKNTTQKTIWKKILKLNTVNTAVKQHGITVNASPVKINGVKLATWSRNFDWTPFKSDLTQKQ